MSLNSLCSYSNQLTVESDSRPFEFLVIAFMGVFK